ncbi:MAG: ubiquinone biosynthesis regulatory protein kinase UbiB, partial [Chromatiaceae bacterium]
PFMEKWMNNQIGPRALWARLKRNLGPYSEGMPELPLLAYRVLQGLDRQSLPIRWRSDELDRLRGEIQVHHARVQALIAGAGLIASGTLLLVFGPGPLISIPAAQVLAVGLILGGGLLLAGRWR